jgi:PKD repeat protein
MVRGITSARLLGAPSVNASDGMYPDHIAVSWTAVEGAASYKVWRAESDGGLDVFVHQTYDLIPNPSWNDYSVTVNTPYWYFVQAIGEDAEGPKGGPDTGFAIVLNPVEVVATDGSYPDRVDLVWGAEPAATEYVVYRGMDESDPMPVVLDTITGSPPACTYSDTTGPWDTPSYYSIAPFVGSEQPRGVGDYGSRGLTTPQNVTATQGTDALGVTVDWDAVNNATRYAVYRMDAPGIPTEGDRKAIVTAPQTDYFDDTAAWGGTEGVHSYYFVTARWDGPDVEQSAFGAPVQGWRGIGVPQNVAASDGTYPDQVAVSWDTVAQATSYKVYRDPTGAGFPATVNAPMTVYYDTDITTGTEYTYTVIACVADGEGVQSAPDTGFANQPPVITEFTATPSEGDAPLTVDFTVTANDPDGTIVKYEWDWESDGTYDEDTGTTPTAQHTYDTAGEYTCTVRVTDERVGQDTSTLFIKALTWRWETVLVDSAGDVGSDTSLQVVNGYPAISYYDITNEDLKYVRALNIDGSSWGTPITIDGSGTDVGGYTTLRVANGYPAIAYHDSTDASLKYVRATDVDGVSWGLPLTVDGELGDPKGLYASMCIVNGFPAISYYQSSAGRLYYVRANNANGSSWGTPMRADPFNADLGMWTSLQVVNGNPAISYFEISFDGRLRYVRADDANGSSWETTPLVLDWSTNTGRYSCMYVVNGNPAICYVDGADQPNYIRALDASGTTWDSNICLNYPSWARYPKLGVFGGKPIIVYQEGGDLVYLSANDADGTTWAAPTIVEADSGSGGYCSLQIVNAHPAISYYDGTNGNLKYAYYTTDP